MHGDVTVSEASCTSLLEGKLRQFYEYWFSTVVANCLPWCAQWIEPVPHGEIRVNCFDYTESQRQ